MVEIVRHVEFWHHDVLVPGFCTILPAYSRADIMIPILAVIHLADDTES